MFDHSINMKIRYRTGIPPFNTLEEECDKDLNFSNETELVYLIENEITTLRSTVGEELEKGNPVQLTLTIPQPTPDFLLPALKKLIKKNFDSSCSMGINAITISNDDANFNPQLKTLFDNYNKRRLSFTMPFYLSGITSTILAALFRVLDTGAAPLILLFSFITAGLRHWYLGSSAKSYDAETINEISDHQVLTALKKGADSSLGIEGMGHYVLSYFSVSSWKHPRAFAAGLHIGNENDQDSIETIQNRYDNLKP